MHHHHRLIRLEQLLLTVWVGSLLAIAYLAVPILFSQLEDRSLAGAIAGQMFNVVYLLGLVCGLSLLLTAFIIASQGFLRQWRHWLLVAMLLLIVLALFVMQPQMEAIKLQAEWREQAELASRFGRLHGLASVMYLATSVMGVVLVVMGLRVIGGKGQGKEQG